jgi:hypothetical protein
MLYLTRHAWPICFHTVAHISESTFSTALHTYLTFRRFQSIILIEALKVLCRRGSIKYKPAYLFLGERFALCPP